MTGVPHRNSLRAGANLDSTISKRFLDLVLAFVALALLWPLMLVIALVIFFTLGRPILFSQQRVGGGGMRFPLFKFRTLPLKSVARSDCEWLVEPSGRAAMFLRATGLDELPQLFQVLRGQMSLVGPRPERPLFVERFQNELPFYTTRHRLPVGITGWAQVNGLRGDTSIAQRVLYDLYYLSHRSIAFDLKILAMTVAGFWRTVWSFDYKNPHAPADQRRAGERVSGKSQSGNTAPPTRVVVSAK